MAPSANPQPSTISTSSVRRNLFTNHLSHRRPDPSTSTQTSEPIRNPSANSSTHSLSNLCNAPAARRPASRSQSNDSFNNPVSARHSRSHTDLSSSNPNNSGEIIARDRSGRPDLPEIPLLPPHLRLSGSSEHHPDTGNNRAGEQGMSMENVEGMELESAMREKEDQERIEKSLVDMMYRSRMRGNGHHGHGGGGGDGGLGAENEELLALVQASLRKKAASLEEDRWMFEGDTGEDYGYGVR